MKELILTIGLPGSGKSTYIDNNYLNAKTGIINYQILCLDDIRLAMGNIFNRKVEGIIIAMQNVMARAFMERGLTIVVDSTNISINVVKQWRDLADEYKYYMKGIFFDTPIDTCMGRKLGKNKLTKKVFSRMNTHLEGLRPEMGQLFDGLEVKYYSN